MITFKKIYKKARLFRYLTGLELEEFYEILPKFEQIFLAHRFIDSKATKREIGGGRKSNIETVEDFLVFILVYYKVYPLQIVQGLLFDLDQSNVSLWVKRLSKILEETLDQKMCLPARKAKKLEEILEECPDSEELLMDGTEREIARPLNREIQKDNYSGKKKKNTKKNIVITNKTGKVLYLSETYDGKVHDKKIADTEKLKFPKGTKVGVDLGFQGYEAEGAIIIMPYKKPRGKELTDEQKRVNRFISSCRVPVEHEIGHIKISRIVKDKYRNKRKGFDDEVMLVATGLHNLRVKMRRRR